jgi:hypothetical protein
MKGKGGFAGSALLAEQCDCFHGNPYCWHAGNSAKHVVELPALWHASLPAAKLEKARKLLRKWLKLWLMGL